MNNDYTFNFKSLRACLLLLSALTLAGCGSGAVQDQTAAAQAQEREKLLAENQALDQARTDNQEVQRLKKENEELPKARNQYQEASRLRKENEQLVQQVAKLTHSNAPPASAADARSNPAGANLAQAKAKELVEQESMLNEGDDILVDPKSLKQLLPDFDWEKLGRKEPIGIRSLIEKDGVVLTNALQLKEYGITNYVIQRAVVKPAGTDQPKP